MVSTRSMYIYSIFDDLPITDPESVLSSFEDVPINCRSAETALEAAIKVARAEGRTCGRYRPDESMYVLVWDLNGDLVKQGSVILGGPGRPAANWRPPKCFHPRKYRGDDSFTAEFDALKRAADHLGALQTDSGRWAFFGSVGNEEALSQAGSWWTVSESSLRDLGTDLGQKGPRAYADWAAKIDAEPLHPSVTP